VQCVTMQYSGVLTAKSESPWNAEHATEIVLHPCTDALIHQKHNCGVACIAGDMLANEITTNCTVPL